MIEVKGLSYLYDKRSTDGISDVNFSVKKGNILALLGPSGSGKSTTLKCIAGLQKDYRGEINFKEKQSLSYVDQYPDLENDCEVFEYLTKSFQTKLTSAQAENQIRTILAQLEMTNEIHSVIGHLSGGQKQRVVMAKSLINNPTLLLLDEPFANLDPPLRTQLVEDLIPIFKEQNITVIWVTHNTEEALRYSNEVVLLNYGKIVQKESPQNIYFRPNSLFCATYFGHCNTLVAKVIQVEKETIAVQLGTQTIELPKLYESIVLEQNILLLIKSELIQVSNSSSLKAKVISREFLGSSALYHLQWDDVSLSCLTPSHIIIEPDDSCHFEIKVDYAHYLAEV